MTGPTRSPDPSTGQSGSNPDGYVSWLLPPQHQSGVVIHIPPDVTLRPDIKAAIDELIQALQTPAEGPAAPSLQCNKIYDGPCATLFACHIGGP